MQGFASSSIYSWSISHFLEHEFFCLGHLGWAGSKEKKWIWVFLSNFWVCFFQLFVGKKKLDSLYIALGCIPYRGTQELSQQVSTRILHKKAGYQLSPAIANLRAYYMVYVVTVDNNFPFNLFQYRKYWNLAKILRNFCYSLHSSPYKLR